MKLTDTGNLPRSSIGRRRRRLVSPRHACGFQALATGRVPDDRAQKRCGPSRDAA